MASSRITNEHRDRTIADLISVSRSLMSQNEEMRMVINNHAAVLQRFQQQLDALTLAAVVQTTGDVPRANQA